MGRSLKKGPFADAHLLKKVEEANASEKQAVIKTWSRRSTIFPSFIGLTMDVSTCQFWYKKTWSVTSLESSSLRVRSADTQQTIRRLSASNIGGQYNG